MAELSAADRYEQLRDKVPDPAPPPPGESELVAWVEAVAEEAAGGRKLKGNDDEWDDWENGFWGDLWGSDPLPSYVLPITINELKSLVLQEVSDLTDTKLRVFVSADPASGRRDEAAEQALLAEWQRSAIDLQVMQACLDALVFPCGWLSCLWDPTADEGQGRILVRAPNPRGLYPDPDAEDDTRWRYLIVRETMDLADIRRLWPDRGPRVPPDDAVSTKLAQPTGWAGTIRQMLSPLWSRAGSFEPNPTYVKARATVTHCFVYDDELEPVPPTAEDDGTVIRLSTKQAYRPKYPHGRLIQVANGRVLYDDKNPYHGPFPYIRVLMQPAIHTFWPRQSIVGENLATLRASNKADSLVVENALRLNKGQIFIPADSGIDPQRFGNLPGQVHLIAPGRQPFIDYPRPMPADMVNLGERLRGFMRQVMGFTPSRAALGSRGNVSAELTETEISQAMGITRLRARLLHQSVQQLVQQLFSRMVQFWTTPRLIPVIENESWRPVRWTPIPDARTYAAYVDPATFAVRSQTMMKRLYLTLVRMGLMPPEEALRMLDIPNAKELAQKIEQSAYLQLQQMRAKRGRTK
jgi:hypothetical protein